MGAAYTPNGIYDPPPENSLYDPSSGPELEF